MNKGAQCPKSMTKSVNLLITASDDDTGNKNSSKLLSAMEKGIETWSEDQFKDFLKSVNVQ